jgi:thiol-disulfide isomerase/thioredoxin
MKKITTCVLLCALFILAGLTLSAQTAKKPELLTKETFLEKVWNYEESPNEFKYTGDKPCIIVFYADWCGWCKRIAPFFDEFCNTYDGKIYVYKINADQQKELQSLLQAKYLPHTVFVPMKGIPTAVQGAQSKEQFEQYIKELLLTK